ncbi:dsRBD fold-containing protein [Oerskovia sp. M15]
MVGGAVRDGMVVEVHHEDGSPPFLVEWADTGSRAWSIRDPTPWCVPRRGAVAHEVSVPVHSKSWHVQVSLVESEGRTTAEAILVGDLPSDLHGVGRARKDPGDTEIEAIGDHVAAARALRGLADRLLGLAEAEIEGSTGVPRTCTTEVGTSAPSGGASARAARRSLSTGPPTAAGRFEEEP